MSEGTVLRHVTDRSLFSMHPEDWVSQRDSHDDQSAYFKEALRFALPNCFVARDLAVYWVPGQYQHPYASPDNFVSRQQPLEADPKTWVIYEEGPIDLVIEVASDATRDREPERRDQTYAIELEIPECLYVDLPFDVLQLYRLVGQRYEPVAADEHGVFWSREFGIGFVRRPGERLVRVLTPDGEVIPTYQEGTAQRREAEAQRREAEARAHALEAELERLRRANAVPDARMDGPDEGDSTSGP